MTNCSELIQKYETNGGRKMTDFDVPKAPKRVRITPLPFPSASPYITRQYATSTRNIKNSEIIIRKSDKTEKQMTADHMIGIKKSNQL
jgi:hypothetical protein